MESKHQDLNVYIIKPLNGKGPMHAVNGWQLFNLHKSQGSGMPSNPAPDTKLPKLLVKKPTRGITTLQHVHPMVPGSRPKQIPWYCNYLLRMRLRKIHQYYNHPWRIQGAFESWVTCLTTFQLNYGSKEVTGTMIYSSILHAKITHFFM